MTCLCPSLTRGSQIRERSCRVSVKPNQQLRTDELRARLRGYIGKAGAGQKLPLPRQDLPKFCQIVQKEPGGPELVWLAVQVLALCTCMQLSTCLPQSRLYQEPVHVAEGLCHRFALHGSMRSISAQM